jgi:beta-lactam-binding protein with PASTA domain
MVKKTKSNKNFFSEAYRKVVGWKWFWIVGNLTLAILIASVLIFGLKKGLSWGTNHGETIEVPKFEGLTYKDAQALAQSAGVKITVVDSVYAKKGRGLVREQNPAPGARVKEGRRVFLTMNAFGVQKVAVPNVVGYSTRQAIAELTSRGLVLGKIVYVNDMATNNVLKQRYKGKDVAPGTMVEAESTIDIVAGLNSNNCQTKIPDVRGKDPLEAARMLNDCYINVRSIVYDKDIKTYEDSLSAVVYRQAPESSNFSVKMGTEVTIYLKAASAE